MKIANKETLVKELSKRIASLKLGNWESTEVKDEDLAEFFSEEEILLTSLVNVDKLYELLKRRSFSTYLKLLKALAEAIIKEQLDLITHFDYNEIRNNKL